MTNNTIGAGLVGSNLASSGFQKKQKPAFEVLDPGHRYMVEPTAYGDRVELMFMKKRLYSEAKDGPKHDGTGLVIEHDGLTTEGVLDVLLSRLHFLQSMVPCDENEEAISALKMARAALMRRTRTRQLRGVEGTRDW